MDTRPLVAPGAPGAPARTTLRFEGTTGEYFKIWIVNVALTVVTLGIFSAWAKVRSKRYLYGNTYIGDHAFDYHAPPLRILLGRAGATGRLFDQRHYGAPCRPPSGILCLSSHSAG